ncbi:BrnA antitoxin family protein [Chitinasiproducens palmae]|uniref:Uncharacterized conserved protein, DUF4415 family n=1 Tax=Chitinasiproducens palmae TaxID=1770053 RepID=A0A1H2PSA1_9BURK|nr:BrnA antitoxin family protein [Chitinasiproducens palmae]SDV49806.1 Uncharacterized conserved protein, DUF4415 family [Chitinasiproducens palmae]
MPALKPGTIIPTDEENEAINKGIASDPDTVELTEAHFAQMKPTAQVMKARGRPRLAVTKEAVSIRLDADVLTGFRALGDGWQTRMNEALRDWLQTHKA